MPRHYRLLLVLFVIAVLCQGSFTVDVIRTLSRDYPLKPVTLGAPWPVIVELSREAVHAGLRRDDRVLAIDGRAPTGESDLARAVRAKHPGQSIAITVSRNGAPVEIQVPLRPFGTWWSFALITLIFMPWLSILLGFWVTAMRPRDPRAWLVLGILAGLSQLVRPTVLDPRGWPEIGPIAVAFRQLAAAVWPICMMLFGIYFPQRWTADRRLPWAKWIFILPLAADGIYNAVRDVAASVDYNAAQWPPLLPDLLLTVLTMTAVGVFFMAQLTEDLLGVVGTNVNRLVYDASPENRYATFFYCQFDPATRMLVYTNGGHNPPILLRGSEVIRLEIGGPPVGLFRPAHYQQAEVQLEPADLILFYTDGISEAENSAADEWGEDALIAAARSCHDRPPAEMITRIISAADTFADGAPQHDDMTLVVARVV